MFTRKSFCIAAPFLLLVSQISLCAAKPAADQPTGKLEQMIVDNGVVTLNLDQDRIDGAKSALRFNLVRDSYFTFIAFNNELRTAEAGTILLTAQNAAALPAALKGISLAIE